MTKLWNYLRRLRNRHFGACTIQLSDVLQWCMQNSSIPDNEDQVFVSKHDVHNTNNVSTKRILFTTKRLVRITEFNQYHLRADATYKLIWQGYPVLIIGTTDREKAFHPFGLAVSMNETEQDFSFIFESIKQAAQDICNLNYQSCSMLSGQSIKLFSIISIWNVSKKNIRWFEDYTPGIPSTNNALESFNRTVKEEQSFGCRMAAGQFFEFIKNQKD